MVPYLVCEVAESNVDEEIYWWWLTCGNEGTREGLIKEQGLSIAIMIVILRI